MTNDYLLMTKYVLFIIVFYISCEMFGFFSFLMISAEHILYISGGVLCVVLCVVVCVCVHGIALHSAENV